MGHSDAVDDAIVVPVSEEKITLLEGGHIYEVFAKWTRFEEFGGAAYYSFCTSPLGVTLTAEDVTPNGLTLVCTQSGGTPTGELHTGSPFWLEVYSEGNWFPVKDDMEDVLWTMEAWSIPRNKRVEWNVSWEPLYGSLPTGHYRIGKEITDFRAVVIMINIITTQSSLWTDDNGGASNEEAERYSVITLCSC